MFSIPLLLGRSMASSLESVMCLPAVSAIYCGAARSHLVAGATDNAISLDKQIQVFASLALNAQLKDPATLEKLDHAMRQESTFYTCRAIRRLLLGMCHLPCTMEDTQAKRYCLIGSPFKGPGLIMSTDGFQLAICIKTNMYVLCASSLEATDPCGERGHPRAIYSPSLAKHGIDYDMMFRLASRYVSMVAVEDCVSLFIETLPSPLANMAHRNYWKLLAHLQKPKPWLLPAASSNARSMLYVFSVHSFICSLPDNRCLENLKRRVFHNCAQYLDMVIALFRQPRGEMVHTSSADIITYQETLNQFPHNIPPVQVYRRDPGSVSYTVRVHAHGETQRWLVYPTSCPAYRAVMCLSVAPHITLQTKQQCTKAVQANTPQVPGGTTTPARALAAMFQRMDFAPKDNSVRTTHPWSTHSFTTGHELCGGEHDDGTPEDICSQLKQAQKCKCTRHLQEQYAPLQHVSWKGFKMTAFTTNMVINTKIQRNEQCCGYARILATPRLTSNFVVRKFSMREPACTVSVFYTDDAGDGAAINVNIGGGMLNFWCAMSALHCLLPTSTIFPASVANWNSTIDLHGLENQQLARCGRNGVFWTTNFPSVVSTQAGFNVSWFKAATATTSRVHGRELSQRMLMEAYAVLGHRDARTDLRKNALFATLERRCRYQVQAAHKRFLECLYEALSFLRLDSGVLVRLARMGAFDFSRHTVSHSKSKQECALIGYRRCNSVPKALVCNKKTRLDERGRNANFLTFVAHMGALDNGTKHSILRHIIRRLGLRWRRAGIKNLNGDVTVMHHMSSYSPMVLPTDDAR
uniref:Herpesvirus UL87 C-terminal domain-containing protein n=1 Tax=Otarine gammaherpesvirus 4 TaxID=2801541 RepID=A0A889IVZ6_9GAMA|nr:hypothetical protein [Otarine gammaherpesvirus 4]